MPIKSVMPSSHLILWSPLLLLPPVPPSIRVFSNMSTLHMRWPKFWSFSFSISPSNEHPNKCLPHPNSPTAKWKQTLLPNHQALLLLKIYSARNTHIAQKYTNWISLPQCDQERAQTGPKLTFRPFLGAAEDQE